MPDFIPVSDTQFDAWTTNLVEEIRPCASRFGVAPEDLVQITSAQIHFRESLANAAEAQTRANSAYQTKFSARSLLENQVRAVVQNLLLKAELDEEQQTRLGLVARDAPRIPVAGPKSRPLLTVDNPAPLHHAIAFADESSPDSFERPHGVRACEIFVKIGGRPPSDLFDCTYLATDTHSPYLAVFDEKHASEVIHYVARWVNTHGEVGPISDPTSATL